MSQPESVTTKDIPVLVQDLQATLDECDAIRQQFKSEYETFKAQHDRVVEEIKDIAKKLHDMHKDVAISNVSGASAGIVFGSSAAVLLILAPFTGGATLIPAAICGAGAVAGGLTSGIASAVEGGVTKKRCETAQKSLGEFDKAKNELLTIIDDLGIEIDELDAIIQLLSELQVQMDDSETEETKEELLIFQQLLLRSAAMNGVRKVLTRTEDVEPGDSKGPTGSVAGPVAKLAIDTPLRAAAVPVGHYVLGPVGEKVGAKLGARGGAAGGRAGGRAAGTAVGRRAGSFAGRAASRMGGSWIGKAVGSTVTKGVGGFAGRIGMQAGQAAGRSAGRVLGQTLGRAILGPAISVVFVGVDIWTLVSASKTLHRGAKSQAGEELDKLVSQIEEASKILEKLYKAC